MRQPIKVLLTPLEEQIRFIYGERLKGVYLFGSYARNEADEESDIDVLIVLDHVDRYADEIARTSAIISDLSLIFGVTISRVFASEERWKTDQTNFFLNIREEAVPV